MAELSEKVDQSESGVVQVSSFPSNSDATLLTKAKERKLLARIDLHVMPAISAIYLLAFLDRVNIGNALIYKLPTDLRLHGSQINVALSVFFVSYILFDVPATVAMKMVKPHISLSVSMFVFGLLVTLQGFVQSYGGLVTTRFLLGIAEAGIYPGCYYLISMWYTRSEVQKRFTFFSCAATLAAAFGGLLASAIGKMDGIGGYSAWRWIFILEGILTCVLSTVLFLGISDFPENAKWLTDQERLFVEKRLIVDQGNSGFQHKFGWSGLVVAFKDWKMVPAALMYFGADLSAYGLVYFIPSIVSTYGYTPIESQLHSAAPWGAAVVFAMILAYLSDISQKRFPFIMVGLSVALTGNAVLLTVHGNRHVEYAAIYLYLMGVVSVLPLMVCWFAMNLDGHVKRAVGIPWQVGVGNLAGIIAAFAFPSADAPIYRLGYSLGMGFLCFALAASTAYFVGCWLENRKRPKEKRFML